MPDSARFGPYRLQGEIGRGAMGVVYRAYDERHARVVALKVLSPDISSDTDYRHRFEQESHIVAALTDPHVIPIHSYGEIDQHLYLDMRLVEGRSVKERLRDSGPMTPTQAVSIISQVADALDSAHADGVIHRDVKPSNVLIARHVASRHGRDDFAYLVDFGIARSLGGTGMTSIGFTVGTIDYMAPERFDGQKSGVGADVYALGCLLAECLTGRKPFPGVEVAQVVRGHLHSPPPRPSQMVPGVPTGFDAVVAKAMDKQPGDRYHSAGELADDARSVLSAGGFDSGPYRPSGPPPAPGRGFDVGALASNSVPAGPIPTGSLPDLGGPGAGFELGPGGGPSAGPSTAGSGAAGSGAGRPVPFAAPMPFTGPASDSSGPRPTGASGPLSSPPPPSPSPPSPSPPSPPPPSPPPPAPPRSRVPNPGLSGSHGLPVSTASRDRKVILAAACAAVLIIVAGIVAVVVHRNNTVESCASGAGGGGSASVVACGQTSPSPAKSSTPAGLTANEKDAAKAIGTDAVCTSASIKLAPAAQAAYVDAAVSCPMTVAGAAKLYAFHLKSVADTTDARDSLANYGSAKDSYGYDSFLNRTTGTVAQGTWATTYATTPQFVLVWPTFQVEVVVIGSNPTASAEALLTSLRSVSWQYGNFGGTPDYGSQAKLRSYTNLTSCAPHRLEEISATEYLLNVAWLVCAAPKTQPSFTSIQLFRVDTAAHAKADLKHEVDAGYLVLKNLKGADGATGQCVAYRGSISTVTSIFCQYPSISGYDQVHLESQLETTMSFAATKKFFTTHSIDMPTMFGRA